MANRRRKKTFLIGECGKKIELNTDPILKINLSSSSSINPLQKVRREVVDKAYSSLPERSKTSKEEMCSAMKKAKESSSLTEGESAWLVYKWITNNIKYDCYGYEHNTIDYSEDGTYSKGKGVCAGFSLLFTTFAKALGLNVFTVRGYLKNMAINQEIKPLENHAWNSIEID